MTLAAYTDADAAVLRWLSTTPVAALLHRPDGGVSLFLAMPPAAPLPALVVTRVGGAPPPASDIPIDLPRLSCDCWGRTRGQAQELSRTLAVAFHDLGPVGGWVDGPVRLLTAEVVSWVWAPDPDADTPRYIVDAVVAVLSV